MTRRVFVSAVRTGLAAVATEVKAGRATFTPSVEFAQELPPDAGGRQVHGFPGAPFAVVGPGDVVGFDHNAVLRCEPPPGTLDALENNLVTLDLSDARLPWLLSLPGMKGRPWCALIVLREDEGDLAPGSPLPTVDVPASALPDPDDLASWAHVEVRLEDGEDLAAVVATECRTGTDRVVARLVCPRRLEPHKGWLACLVPTTLAGKAAGEGRRPSEAEAGQPAWARARPVTLPVYFSWRFRTGEAGSFEDLARLVEPVERVQLQGTGKRTVDVSHPWPHMRPPQGTTESVTLTIEGALRVPGEGVPAEEWSDAAARDAFRDRIGEVLNAPGRLAADRDEGALAPPLYGSHHTGHRAVPGAGWMHELNLQVRHRIAASLGARYVQVEQEFLMERAWEQVGEVREANRRMAAAELAAATAVRAQEKHLSGMAEPDLTTLADPVSNQVHLGGPTLASVLEGSAVPDGVASTAFLRVVRRGGAVHRRARRAAKLAQQAGADMSGVPVVTAGLSGVQVVPVRPVAWLRARAATTTPTVAVDHATRYGSATMLGLLQAQAVLFKTREDLVGQAPLQQMAQVTSAVGGGMQSTAATALSAGAVRKIRREVLGEEVRAMPPVTGLSTFAMSGVAAGITAGLEPMPQQLRLIAEHIQTPDMAARTTAETRPLRRYMNHPRFGFPIGAELLVRWPEWTIPGITTFPENRVALLETNPQFVEAVMVGLNQELNRELLWREYPTDQAGTPFTRFWPCGAGEFGEIALWGDEGGLGSHDPTGGAALLTVLIRADVLRRFPGSLLLAVQADGQRKVPSSGGNWKQPLFTLPVDERTCVFGFDLTLPRVEAESWLFVLREPMRGTQFGFDLKTGQSPPLTIWANLTWDDVPRSGAFAHASASAERRPRPSELTPADPEWGPAAADMAYIAFQRPFQVAFSPKRLLGD